MIKRTEVVVSYNRTVQIPQYCPISLGVSTTLKNEDGVTLENIKAEEKVLEEFVDHILEVKSAKIS